MVCLEVKFDERGRFELERFLLQEQIAFFEKVFEGNGCMKLFIPEREKVEIVKKLNRCEMVNRVRGICVEEVMI